RKCKICASAKYSDNVCPRLSVRASLQTCHCCSRGSIEEGQADVEGVPTRRSGSAASVPRPKAMVPRHISETLRPLRLRRRDSIPACPCPELVTGLHEAGVHANLVIPVRISRGMARNGCNHITYQGAPRELHRVRAEGRWNPPHPPRWCGQGHGTGAVRRR